MKYQLIRPKTKDLFEFQVDFVLSAYSEQCKTHTIQKIGMSAARG